MNQTIPVIKHNFAVRDIVVHPTCGIGRITAIRPHDFGGMIQPAYVISIKRELLTIFLPTAHAAKIGLRKLAPKETSERVVMILKQPPRSSAGTPLQQSHKQREKVNSGDLIKLAEVVRDLYRVGDALARQSFDTRRLYDDALKRLIQEVALIRGESEQAAAAFLEDSHRGRFTSFCRYLETLHTP